MARDRFPFPPTSYGSVTPFSETGKSSDMPVRRPKNRITIGPANGQVNFFTAPNLNNS